MPAGKGEFTVKGDINPVDLLVAAGQEVRLPANPFVVTIDIGESMSSYGGNTSSSGGYESAGHTMFADLLEKSFPGREIVANDRSYIDTPDGFKKTVRRTKSSAERIVVSKQLKAEKGERNAGRKIISDSFALVAGRRTLPPKAPGQPPRYVRDRRADVVYLFEPTIMVDFLKGKSEMYQDKQSQSLDHLLKIVTREDYEEVRAFVYTIAIPQKADDAVKKHLSEVQQSIQLAAPGKEIYIVHRHVQK